MCAFCVLNIAADIEMAQEVTINLTPCRFKQYDSKASKMCSSIHLKNSCDLKNQVLHCGGGYTWFSGVYM
jgi:hypothetical protein